MTKETRDTVFPTEAANFFWITETNSFGYSTVKLESCLEDPSYRYCKYLSCSPKSPADIIKLSLDYKTEANKSTRTKPCI